MRLILMRHGVASFSGSSDHERPLERYGRTGVAAVAGELRARGWLPTQIVSSTAQRCRETVSCVYEEMAETIPNEPSDELYLCSVDTVLEVLQRAAGASPLLIVGHNPSMEETASRLTGVSVRMGQGNAVLLRTGVEGDEVVVDGAWRLVDEIVPP